MARFEISTPTTIGVNNQTGNDGSGSLTSKFASINAAAAFVSTELIINNARVTLQVDSTGVDYAPVNLMPWVGTAWPDPSNGSGGDPGPNFAIPTIRGNPSNPESVRINANGGTCIVGVGCYTPWFIHGFRLAGSLTDINKGGLVICDFGSRFYLGQNNYGPAADYLIAEWDSMIEVINTFGGTIYGNGSSFAHVVRNGCVLAQGSNPFILSGNPNFGHAFAIASDPGSIVDLTNASWAGGMTGMAYWGSGKPGASNDGKVVNPQLLPGTQP